jgi:hypothetical protein
MKITLKELRSLIRESVRRVLKENEESDMKPSSKTQIALGDRVVASRDFTGFVEGADEPWVAIKQGTVGTVFRLETSLVTGPVADVFFPGVGLISRTSTQMLQLDSSSD